jgi:8-oxo-dGTP pyrophosphatase MutT (NUDIX family)
MSQPNRGTGDGWARCLRGHRHWGRFGAAGILITDGQRVILQHRAAWTHEGGTWAVPGGARDRHEDAVTAALREAAEETTLCTSDVRPGPSWIDDHGGWSYTTVVARARGDLCLQPANQECTELRWWPVDEVASLPLHWGFAGAWPSLRGLIDTAN